MIALKDFLQAVNLEALPQPDSAKSWYSELRIHRTDLPELEGVKLAFFGLNDGACDAVRQELYSLVQHYHIPMADLGNILQSASHEDTGVAISEVTAALLRENIMPVFVVEDQRWGYYYYRAFEHYGSYVSLAWIGSGIKLWDQSGHGTLLNRIFAHRPNFLFNFSAIGYQSYFTESETLQALQKMYFDTYRLGWVNQNMEEAEPLLRSCDLLMTDMSAVRASDFAAQPHPSPNGFFGDEMCRLIRYAGMSNKMNGWVISGLQSSHAQAPVSAALIAQMFWYFVDGYMARLPENPEESEDGFLKYKVGLKEHSHEITFYKSLRTDKWWMEIPNPQHRANHHGPIMVPCSYQDYLKATTEEIPERWWNIYQKLM